MFKKDFGYMLEKALNKCWKKTSWIHVIENLPTQM